jgi:carbamoyltransferase
MRGESPVTAVLGVSGEYHDAAAAVVVGGVLVAAAEEERFTRVKHDPSLPRHAIAWCLEEAGVEPGGLSDVVFYDKPLTTYERILSTHAKVGPRGFPALSRAVSTWSRSKLWVGARLERILTDLGHPTPRIAYSEHHLSHAASAFYPSPFESAAVLTFDGVGEWATSSIAHGRGNGITMQSELRFPDSIGLFYSAMTAFCGFEVNDGEYKLMGLAPYGEPRYAEALRERVVQVADDGSVRLDQRWFAYRAGGRMTRRPLAELLDGPPLVPGTQPGQREADIARSVQVVLEEIVLRMADHAHRQTGETRACLAGGVALNCVANERLLAEGPFEEIWVQPASGDAGGAVGAALWGWHGVHGHPRTAEPQRDSMSGAFLGPSFSTDEVHSWLDECGLDHEVLDDDELFRLVAAELDDGHTVGWFRGRAEFGPRALGHRSILADPRDSTMAQRLNIAVKGREGFRPFAPAVLEEHASDWFELDRESPYMLFTAKVHEKRLLPDRNGEDRSFAERLSGVRSEIPACTHVDNSARVQTVSRATNADFHRLLEEFHALTDCPVLINTSFNRAGEPVVLTPADALRCFAGTALDVLVLENCVVRRDAIETAQVPG